MAQSLTFSLIQTDIFWEDNAANLAHYKHLIEKIEGKKEIVLLPEMFSTGFSMAPERLAERMDGATVQWMMDMAAKYHIILAGSIIIEEEGNYYNRFIWMQPDGTHYHYDKRHLFGYGDEDKHYAAGEKKLIVQVKGWKICPFICYDLRFPVWARNVQAEYDVLLYVANWPERRGHAWKVLLQARAIENQAYVIGVNRIGTDGTGLTYSGDSAVSGPLGEPMLAPGAEAGVYTITLDKDMLTEAREKLPFLKDGDKFILL